MSNQKRPTEAATKAAEEIYERIKMPWTVHALATIIDKHTDLPRLTVIAMCAQGVVDRFDKNDATDALEAIDQELRDALKKENP